MQQPIQGESWTQGFSCPHIAFQPTHAAHILSSRAQVLLGLYLDQFGQVLQAESDGLSAYLATYATNQGGLELWDWSLGKLYETVVSQNKNPNLAVIAGFALHLGLCGHQGSWRVVFDQPTQLMLGRWVLPETDAIQVTATLNRLEVATGRGQLKQVFTLIKKRDWQTETLTSLPTQTTHQCRLAFINDAVFFSGTNGLENPIDREGTAEIMGLVDRAMRIIHKNAPLYFPWVQRLIHYILPVVSPVKGSINSGNIINQHGIIQLSNASIPHQMAEMLVHEASHQYFHLLEMASSFDDGTDTNTYLSPVVQKFRPLRRILLAYHAFANVILLGRALCEAGLEDGYWHRNEDLVLRDLVHLDSPLRNNPALTEFGRSLYAPLAIQLAEVGVSL